MRKQIRSVKIRTEQYQETLDDLKQEFERLRSICPDFSRRDLIPFDPYFNLAIAKDDIRNLKKGTCGYEKTRRIVDAFRAYVYGGKMQKDSIEKTMKRQKLEI